ncbi:DUF192 domain-containing protein [Candidatus Micrarchaeota archaeon]|nr:DUF192 domain-containing protein [Candidatus Micrarchaeota archaeon]
MPRIPCIVLRTFFEQMRGLMFSGRFTTPLLFVLPQPRIFAIHSMFCPPFDAVFLDADCKVIDVFAVRSTRLWIQPRREALYLIEGPPGFGSGLKEGQAIGVDVHGAWLDLAR